ncbi:hypothetical protein BDZ97DRAFT_1772135, partial [Flammula alnicola]
FDIDESTIVGGAEVVDAIFNVLDVKKDPGWSRIVKFFCGDQLTIARLRALVNIRAGHEGGYTGFGWGVWMPGLFHAKMTDIHVSKKGSLAEYSEGHEGDMVFENAILFLRDTLLSREFTDAVKAGDSGRVVLVLKTWALSFRGSGRTNNIVFNNWLINPTGNRNSWIEVDLMQEHMNFWIKVRV